MRMELKDDSIKMLEMRMRQQMNSSTEKNIKPENIPYYISSAMLHKEKMQRETYIDGEKAADQADEEMQPDIWELDGDEEDVLQDGQEPFGLARSLEKEKEEYRQKLLSCRTKEEVRRIEDKYLRLERLGLSMTENHAALPVERRLEYTLFKDEKIAAIRDMTKAFMESEEYVELPTDAEYVKKCGGMPMQGGNAEASGDARIPETKEVQHAKARNGYERIRRSMDGEDVSGNVRVYSFNVKG